MTVLFVLYCMTSMGSTVYIHIYLDGTMADEYQWMWIQAFLEYLAMGIPSVLSLVLCEVYIHLFRGVLKQRSYARLLCICRISSACVLGLTLWLGVADHVYLMSVYSQ
ncbi:hypothetical protein KIPB_014475, partial [Kipferlia bialata]|eukprot:g14475.t1